MTIVQHPGGEKKQIALRENRIVDVLDAFLHYEADTEPGSSGSPVFDDGWEVVALHHASVRAPDQAELGGFLNEGIRASGLREFITAQSFSAEREGARRRAVRMSDAPSIARPRSSKGSPSTPTTRVGEGTTPDFLGTDTQSVPLPVLSDELAPLAAVEQPATAEPALRPALPPLQRRHEPGAATCVLHRRQHRRRDEHAPQARDATAGSSIRACRRSEQTGEDAYRNNPLDRGHLVRRLDPAWGASRDEAKRSNDDTFHFTNCSPQHEDFNQNQTTWAGLEDYILENADNRDLKVTVFTGPVFAPDDERLRRRPAAAPVLEGGRDGQGVGRALGDRATS